LDPLKASAQSRRLRRSPDQGSIRVIFEPSKVSLYIIRPLFEKMKPMMGFLAVSVLMCRPLPMWPEPRGHPRRQSGHSPADHNVSCVVDMF
jgi:hypothetical protein